MSVEPELSQDESLLQAVTKAVLDNLDNGQFGVEELSAEIGVSRSHLHRKLKLLKGQSVSQYVRKIRLEEGRRLLEKDVGSVSEIAYRVGFNSSSYFHKCFQDEYGYPPGDIKGSANQPMAEQPVETAEASIEEVMTKGQPAGRKWLSLAIGALGVVSLVIAAIYFWPKPSMSKSIAVLPLDYLSENPDQEYLAEGLHDALIGSLGQMEGLRVISRTSTLKYRDANMTMPQIAEELGVDMLLEGSFFLEGNKLRLQAQLIAPFPEERHLWAQEYNDDLGDVLFVQSRIVNDIAGKIGLELGPDASQQILHPTRVNPETYKAYVRGMYYINKGGQDNREKGIQFLRTAVDEDPADPLAYAGLALAYIEIAHGTHEEEEVLVLARAALRKALDLDSTLVEAHAARGRLNIYFDWDWEAAEESFRYVNRVNPNMASNHYHFSWYLDLMGRREEAVAEHVLAAELDPLLPKNTAWLSYMYANYGMLEEARAAAERASAIDSTAVVSFIAWKTYHNAQGNEEEAIKWMAKQAEVQPWHEFNLAALKARYGDSEHAWQVIREYEELEPSAPIAWMLATLYTSVGENSLALDWLEYGLKDPVDLFPWVRVVRWADPLHGDPRFDQLLADMGLPPVLSEQTSSL